MHEDMIHVLVHASPTGTDDATHSSPAHLRELYSPECVEGVFCEVRSARSRSGIYSGLAPSAVQRTMPTMSSIACSSLMPCVRTIARHAWKSRAKPMAPSST